MSEDDEEDYINYWNPYREYSAYQVNHAVYCYTNIYCVIVLCTINISVYQLQQKAPTPRCVTCRDPVSVNVLIRSHNNASMFIERSTTAHLW